MAVHVDQESIREAVSKTYTKALTQPQGGCCGTVAVETGPAPSQKACAIGYAETDISAVPADAVENSFGCGNPLAFSGVKEGDTVVDLGSGAGIDLIIAARKTGPSGHVIGIDMTDAMIERARANAAKAGLDNIEVRKGIIEELPVESNTVDWVISNCVINLSPDKPRVFSEIARVLKPGGQLLVSDIVVERFPRVLRRSMALYGACVGGAIGEEAYLSGMRSAGLEAVSVRHRHVFDRSQMVMLTTTELSGGRTLQGISGFFIRKGIGFGARWMEGRVKSVQVYGRKPQCCATAR